MLVAILNDQIVGAAENRPGNPTFSPLEAPNHLCLLFVNKKFHNQGIGKKLFSKVVEKVKSSNPEVDCMSVHSSLYAIHFYEKLGFVRQTKEIGMVDGCASATMKIDLTKFQLC